jgi:hypothetical protein
VKREFKGIKISETIYGKCPPMFGVNAVEVADVYENPDLSCLSRNWKNAPIGLV